MSALAKVSALSLTLSLIQCSKFSTIHTVSADFRQHASPHSRQCAPGAVPAALAATSGSVTKEGAAAAGKCGVSSISARVPPSWSGEGEEQLFSFYLHGAFPLEGDGNGEKLHATELKPRKLQTVQQREFWEIPCPKSRDSDGGPAVFEEKLDGDHVP